MNLFLSYHRFDRPLGLQIYDACLRAGISAYIDFPSFSPDDIDTTVRKWMAATDVVLAIWSEGAQTSELSRAEVRVATELGKRVILIPMLQSGDLDLPITSDALEILQPTEGLDLPTAIANYLSASPTYSCFISYSQHDEPFVSKLYSDLTNSGIRCWFAPHDMRGGQKIHEQIYAAIGQRDRLLLVISEYSMKSRWAETEIAKALHRGIAEHSQILYPVRLVNMEKVRSWEAFDADSGTDLGRVIREYFIPDFSNWDKPEAYDAALSRLVQDLKGNRS